MARFNEYGVTLKEFDLDSFCDDSLELPDDELTDPSELFKSFKHNVITSKGIKYHGQH